MGVLYIRDENGIFKAIRAIKGADGKSAYEQAKEGGYTGTEEEFIALLNGLTAASLSTVSEADSEHITDYDNPHNTTATQVGAIPTQYPTSSDLNVELTKGGNSVTIYCYYGETLNTPHKEGKTTCTHGMVITDAHSDKYATQLCLPSGESKMFIRSVSNGQISGWIEIKKPTAQDVGALPIEGGVITGSVLGIGNGLAQVVGGPTFSSISAVSQDNANTYRLLRAINPDLASYSKERAAQFIDVQDGVPYEYNLFGEHNASHFGLGRVYVGSYVGKGVYGPTGETTIPQALPFVPKFMYVISAANIKANFFFELGVGFAVTSPGSTTTHALTCRLDGTKPYWYSNSDALNQLNANGNTYYFVALG